MRRIKQLHYIPVGDIGANHSFHECHCDPQVDLVSVDGTNMVRHIHKHTDGTEEIENAKIVAGIQAKDKMYKVLTI